MAPNGMTIFMSCHRVVLSASLFVAFLVATQLSVTGNLFVNHGLVCKTRDRPTHRQISQKARQGCVLRVYICIQYVYVYIHNIICTYIYIYILFIFFAVIIIIIIIIVIFMIFTYFSVCAYTYYIYICIFVRTFHDAPPA